MTTVLANPAKMIAKGAPRVIHNDAELEAYTEALFQLTALKNPSPSEEEAIELLKMALVEACRADLKVVHIPEPEVLQETYWKK